VDELEYEACQLKSSLVSLRAKGQEGEARKGEEQEREARKGEVQEGAAASNVVKQARPDTINTIEGSTVGLSSGLAASIQRTKSLIIGADSPEPRSPGPMVKGVFLLAALAGATADEFAEGQKHLDTAEQKQEYSDLQQSSSVDQLDTKSMIAGLQEELKRMHDECERAKLEVKVERSRAEKLETQVAQAGGKKGRPPLATPGGVTPENGSATGSVDEESGRGDVSSRSREGSGSGLVPSWHSEAGGGSCASGAYDDWLLQAAQMEEDVNRLKEEHAKEREKLLGTIEQLKQVAQRGSSRGEESGMVARSSEGEGERKEEEEGGGGLMALEREVEELTDALRVQASIAADKIAFQNFVVNDVALFLPTPGRRDSSRRWAASELHVPVSCVPPLVCRLLLTRSSLTIHQGIYCFQPAFCALVRVG
jgi:hypothetical protein